MAEVSCFTSFTAYSGEATQSERDTVLLSEQGADLRSKGTQDCPARTDGPLSDHLFHEVARYSALVKSAAMTEASWRQHMFAPK